MRGNRHRGKFYYLLIVLRREERRELTSINVTAIAGTTYRGFVRCFPNIVTCRRMR